MPKKRTIVWLTLALIVVGALCLLLWLLPEQESEDGSSNESIHSLFDSNDPDAINALSFVCGDNQKLSFIRTDDGWQADGQSKLPISKTRIDALLDRLERMLALRTIIEHCEDPSEYGLDAPYCSVSITVNGNEKTYLFGSYSDYYSGYYCMLEGTDTVYMVDEDYVNRFDLTLEDLLGSDRLPDLGSLQKVVWQSADGTLLTATPDGEHSELLSLLSSLELGKWIDYGSKQYSVYGLDSPAAATLTLWDGAPLTLTFGMGETEEFIYLRVGESEMIYLAVCNDLAALGDYISGTIETSPS